MDTTKTKDRHRKGYFKDYAKKTGRKDRHRKGYYHDYNLAHPERLARIGIDVASVKCKDGSKLVRDEDGKLYKEVTTKEVQKMDAISFAIFKKEHTWHDDSWEEDSGD